MEAQYYQDRIKMERVHVVAYLNERLDYMAR